MASLRATQILSSLLDEGLDRAALPQRLVMDCARNLPITGAGLALMTASSVGGMLAATDGPATILEELQFTLGEGPCVDSSLSGRPVLHPDLAKSGPERWPGFCAGALEAGVRAVFAFPLRVGGIRVGVLDLYRDRVGGLSDASLGEAISYADAATTLLLHLQAQYPMDEIGGVWVSPDEDRAQVHQATGMISVQAQVSLAEALLLLRARAFASERPISDVARDVVARILRFSEDGDSVSGDPKGGPSDSAP